MSAAFNNFKSTFEGDIVTADHADYESAIARWAANAIRRAKIVAFVKHEQDVSLAIKYAVAEKLPVAIRGGGHSTPGASSAEDGLVIDLSRYVTGVRINKEKKEATVGGGALWGAVEKAAIGHGLAAVAGTVNHTGVGGLTLGGGHGFLSGAYGYTIDNLLQARVVVADGSILTANESENEDLFWAIRGSGSNFGVCTEFVFRLHEQRRTVYSGVMIFPDPLVEGILKLTEAWVSRGLAPEACMIQGMGRMPTPDRTPAVMCIIFYNGSEDDGRKVFKEFLDLKPIDLTKQIPFEELNTQQNEIMYHGQQIYEKAVTQAKYSAEVSMAVYKAMVEYTSKYPDLHIGSGLFVQNREKLSTPSKNAMAFNNRSGHLDYVTFARWEKESPEYSQHARESCRAMLKIVSDREANPEASQTRAYGNLNGDAELSPDRSRMLFGDNYTKLQQLKKKYDPGMIFNKWYPITPAE